MGRVRSKGSVLSAQSRPGHDPAWLQSLADCGVTEGLVSASCASFRGACVCVSAETVAGDTAGDVLCLTLCSALYMI